MNQTLARRVVAEALGTCFLLAAVVGSGIMAERLAGADIALALLANTIATGVFANPAVTIARSLSDTFTGIAPGNVLGFVLAQMLGGVTATVVFRWLIPRKQNKSSEAL